MHVSETLEQTSKTTYVANPNRKGIKRGKDDETKHVEVLDQKLAEK